MTDILQKDHVSATSDHDLAVLRLGSHTLRMYYPTTFEIVQAIRVAAKLAMRHEGVNPPSWREVLGSLGTQLPDHVPRHKSYRRSGLVSNVNQWSVAWENQLVVLKFDELTCKLHYSDALRLHVLLRAAAHNAKRWAGDTTRAIRSIGYLADAEENDKLNVA